MEFGCIPTQSGRVLCSNRGGELPKNNSDSSGNKQLVRDSLNSSLSDVNKWSVYQMESVAELKP